MDMKKKLLFVFNPCSGKAQIKNQLLDIVDTMVKADYEVTIYPTQCAGDAKEKVEAYAGNYDLVVCSGGDGTLDEVVIRNDAMQSKSSTGNTYRPEARTNFASSLGIPKVWKKRQRRPSQENRFRAMSVCLMGIILSMSQHLDFLLKCLIRRARNGKMYSDMPLIFWKAQNAFMISHPL